MIIADTGFFLALFNASDDHHQRSRTILNRLDEPLITTHPVICETCYLLVARGGALSQAQKILNSATTQAEFQLKLDLIEAILANKFPSLNISEVQKMLNLREADVTQTRFYQEVLQIGRQEGVQIGRQEGMQIGRQEVTQEGVASLLIRILIRRCGNLNPSQLQKVRSLSIDQLESLGESLLDFHDVSDLNNWLKVVKTI